MNDLSLDRDLLTRLSEEDASSYDAHPPPIVLSAYAAGTLAQGGPPDPQGVARGALTQEARAQVGLHVKTCARCWAIVVAQRVQAPPAKGVSTSFSRWFTLPRLALSLSYVVVLAVGLTAGAWLRFETDPDVGEMAPTLSSLPPPASGKGLDGLLAQAGLDWSRFDFQRPLIRYVTQSGDTLAAIAQAQWGDGEDGWVLVFLLNHAALKGLENPKRDALEPGLMLKMPALK